LAKRKPQDNLQWATFRGLEGGLEWKIEMIIALAPPTPRKKKIKKKKNSTHALLLHIMSDER